MGKIVNTFDAVVVGGGVAGLSTAMQLASRGFRVVVLERQQLGSGSTGRAAGLLGQLRGTAEQTRMLIEGVRIVRELEQRAGVEITVQTGSVRVAETPERAEEIGHLVDMGKSIGFPIDHVPVEDVARLLPHMKTDDLLAASLCPTDGLFHCTGFSGHGIVQSPAIGVIIADLIVNGQSDYDIAAIEADRFHARCDLTDRQQIDTACRTMAGYYYGAVEGKSDCAT